MNREEHVVIKDKTFTDIAVNELADVKARLMIYRYYHQNKTAAKLPVFKKFLTCYEQMNDYDKLRVDRKATDLFANYMTNPLGSCGLYSFVYFSLALVRFLVIICLFM